MQTNNNRKLITKANTSRNINQPNRNLSYNQTTKHKCTKQQTYASTKLNLEINQKT